MPRPPLELETWGKIRRTTIGGKPTAVAYYRDSDGQTRPMQRQGKTGADAERNLIRAMKQRLAPASEDLTPVSTVNQAAQKWWAEPERAELATGTRARYKGALEIIQKGLGEVRLGEATVPRCDRFLKRVVEVHGAATARNVRTVLSQVLALAARHGAIGQNPIRDTGKVAAKKKPVTAPSVEDVRALRWIMWAYDTTPDKRGVKRSVDLGDLLDMYIATGARTAEILALTWYDINLTVSPATVTIDATLIVNEAGKLERQEHPKTETSSRELKLPSFAADMLTRRRVESYSESVFPSSVGTWQWPNNMRRHWRDAVKGTPYEGVTPRALRRAVATLLRDRRGVEVAKDQLGHASDQVTSRHYVQPSHAGPDATKELSEWFENHE